METVEGKKQNSRFLNLLSLSALQKVLQIFPSTLKLFIIGWITFFRGLPTKLNLGAKKQV